MWLLHRFHVSTKISSMEFTFAIMTSPVFRNILTYFHHHSTFFCVLLCVEQLSRNILSLRTHKKKSHKKRKMSSSSSSSNDDTVQYSELEHDMSLPVITKEVTASVQDTNNSHSIEKKKDKNDDNLTQMLTSTDITQEVRLNAAMSLTQHA